MNHLARLPIDVLPLTATRRECDPAVGGKTVAVRVRLAASLADVPGRESCTLIGITHSPLLRALALEFLGADPGEPEYLHGYSIHVRHDREIDVEPFNPYEATVPRAPN